MKTIVEILNKTGNRRFLITLSLIGATTTLMALDIKPEYVAMMSSGMTTAIVFWFTQHKEGPSQ